MSVLMFGEGSGLKLLPSSLEDLVYFTTEATYYELGDPPAEIGNRPVIGEVKLISMTVAGWKIGERDGMTLVLPLAPSERKRIARMARKFSRREYGYCSRIDLLCRNDGS